MQNRGFPFPRRLHAIRTRDTLRHVTIQQLDGFPRLQPIQTLAPDHCDPISIVAIGQNDSIIHNPASSLVHPFSMGIRAPLETRRDLTIKPILQPQKRVVT